MQKQNVGFPLLKRVSLTIVVLTIPFTTACGGGGGSTEPRSTSGGIWLSWSAPSERMNGEALAMTDLSGYRIYWGPAYNPTANFTTITDAYTTTYLINGVGAGTYEVAVAAIDKEGLEGPLSNTMTKSVY